MSDRRSAGLFAFSVVNNRADTAPKAVEVPWDSFVKKHERPDVRDVKDGPALILATFANNGGRRDADVEAITGIGLDIDDGQVTANVLRAKLNGYRYVAHKTFSSRPGAERWRVIVPFARPASPAKLRAAFDHFNAQLDGALDPACTNPSRLLYVASCPPDTRAHYECLANEGEPFDAAALPDSAPDAPPPVVSAAEVPARFHELLATDAPLRARWEGDTTELKDVSGSGLDFALASLLAHRDFDAGEIAAILREFEHGKKRGKTDKYIARTVANAIGSADGGATARAAIAELNERHAVVMVGGNCVVLTESRDPVLDRSDITLSRVPDMQNLYANRTVFAHGAPVNAFTYWLKSRERREYAGIVFSPNEDVPGYYNLWRGFAVEPREGDCSLFLAHLCDNVCRGNRALYDYVVAWLACLIQRPSDRPGTSIALRGKQGTGKSLVANLVGSLLGQHYVHVTSPRHLTGNFNAHLKDKLLVCADEAFWAGDKSAEGALKSLVTEDVHVIEFKGKDAFTVRNRVWLLICSNHEWVVPAGLEERRFCVIDVGDAHMQDHAYFARLVEQMDAGGRAALLRYLMSYDVSKVNLRQIPRTGALLENKLRSMTAVQSFVFDLLAKGSNDTMGAWAREVSTTTIHEMYRESASQIGERRRSTQVELGMQLRKIIPGIVRQRKREHGLTRLHYVYRFPSLDECRAAFAEAMGGDLDWDDVTTITEGRR